jgi:glycosyltransferase involved in cell wall biosynthesis
LEFFVEPSSDISEAKVEKLKRRAHADFAASALSAEARLSGWFIPPRGVKIHGLRAVGKRRVFVARRKQMRPEVWAKFPDHPDAITSGFTIALSLDLGGNDLELQYKDGEKRWTTFSRCHIRLPLLRKFWRGGERSAPAHEYEKWIREVGGPSREELAAMRRHLPHFPSRPLISVLLPVYNVPLRWLQRAIDSVRAQIYPEWELCIADDHSTDPAIRQMLLRYSRHDSRIRICFRQVNGHICHASNSALELCRGEFVALLDHDDELPPHALYHVAWEAATRPGCNIIFSDEDKIDERGSRFGPYFKPGWNYDLLLSQNCVSHFGVFRTSLVREIGGFRPGYEGSQDWDLTLRAVAAGGLDTVRHIPRVLYHWRTLESSTASSIQAKPYAVVAGRRAVEDHLRTVCKGARLRDLDDGGWQVQWPTPEPLPLVSIIIPTKNQVELLRTTIESILSTTTYPHLEIVLVDHASDDERARGYIDELATKGVVRLVTVQGDFNWSRFNNLGVRTAKGSVLLFLNNDVRIFQDQWLTELVSQAMRPDVGAVGACLLYPDESVQHAGVVLGMAGVAGHVFRKSGQEWCSMGGRPNLPREVSAVTGACMAVRREVFERAGGFDEVHLPVSYNDVDFCLRLRSMGWRNIYTPFARLIHHESASRAVLESASSRKLAATQEARVVLRRWPEEMEADRFFNRNLSLHIEQPSLASAAAVWPWMEEASSRKTPSSCQEEANKTEMPAGTQRLASNFCS